MPREITILNFGAGVQSTTLYLMMLTGEVPRADYAVFADTQEEPASVYKHIKWISTMGGPKILTGTIGKLGDHLQHGTNSTGGRFASIPAFTKDAKGKVGKMRRQCTREYKISVIERVIRRDILGLKPRQRIPKGTFVTQLIGISLDEAGRALRIEKNNVESKWSKVRFPLMDKFMTRADCVTWLRNFGMPHEVPRSACVFCPFHDNEEWKRLRDQDPLSWKRAVEIDAALRVPGNVVNRKLDQPLFIHRQCVPLPEVNLDESADEGYQTGMREECQGGCGH